MAEKPYQLSEEDNALQEKIKKYVKDELRIVNIENPYQYMKKAENIPHRNVSVQTKDKLGVTVPLLNGEEYIPFPIHRDIHLDLKLLKEYLYSVPVPSRLALFRDIQVHYGLQDEPALRKIVTDEMIHMELYDEANRLTKDC